MLIVDYVVTIDGPMGAEEEERKLEWYINESCPQKTIETIFGTGVAERVRILSVYAEGKELDYIRQNFPNIPYPPPTHRTCIWRGDFARFIFDNLTL